MANAAGRLSRSCSASDKCRRAFGLRWSVYKPGVNVSKSEDIQTKSFSSYRRRPWHRLPEVCWLMMHYLRVYSTSGDTQCGISGDPHPFARYQYQSLLEKARSLLESEIQIASA